MKHFLIDKNYGAYLENMGLSACEVLKKAMLPEDLFAKTYLANTDMTTEDIAFLLGYQEIGSFLRAFTIWTGQTISEYRENFK